MSDSQLILSGLEDNQNEISERCIETSYVNVTPSVQVSLAKRFVRSGSNRVCVLAARTCVPINDDERSSVSNLALRLSDGTNVHMSLSFFDDDLGPAFRANHGAIAMNRSLINPSLYELKGDSRLGKVLLAIVLGAVLGGWLAGGHPGDLSLFRFKALFDHVELDKTSRQSSRQAVPAAGLKSVPASTKQARAKARTETARASRRTVLPAMPVLSPGAAKVSLPRRPGSPSHKARQVPCLFVPPPPPTPVDPGIYQWQVLPGQKLLDLPKGTAPISGAARVSGRRPAESVKTGPKPVPQGASTFRLERIVIPEE